MKIVIIGNHGTGKSELAVKLSRKLKIPVVHLDKLAWEPDFTRVPEDCFIKEHKALLKQRNLIIDGWAYQSTVLDRLLWADIIIYLCYPLEYCLYSTSNKNMEYNDKPLPYDNFIGDRLLHSTMFIDNINRINTLYEPQLQIWLKQLEKKKLSYTFYNSTDLEENYDKLMEKIKFKC
jgi:adenylate kinase family enzyme